MRKDAIPTSLVLSRAFTRRTLSRRTLLAASGLTGLSAVLAACGSDDEGSGDGGSGTAAATVEWWHQNHLDPLLSRWNEVATEFQDENSNVTINVTPRENEAFKTALTNAMQADDPPDLFQSWGGGVLAAYVEAGLVQDITDQVEPVIGNFHEYSLAPYTIDDRIYGLPFNFGMIGFWYNKAHFEEAGFSEPPATWAEYLELVQALKGAGHTPIALAGSEQWPGHYYWAYLAMRIAGVEGFKQAAEERSFDSPEFVEAGQRLQELLALEPFQQGFLGAAYQNEDGQAALVATGQASMELMGHWAPSVQVEASGTEGLGDDLGFMPFPEVEGGAGAITEVMGGGDGWAVGRDAPDAVFDFLNHFFQVDTYRQAVEAEGGPVLSVMPETDDAVQDERLLQVIETASQQTGFQLYLDQDYPPAVGEEVNASTGALIAGEKSPEQVVQDITTVWQREA